MVGNHGNGRAWPLGAIAIAILATAAAQRPKLESSVDLAVPNAPVVIGVGGVPHLVHELHVTNMRQQPLALERVEVLADGVPIRTLEGQALARTLQRIGVARNAPDAQVVGPGMRTVVYCWIPLSAGRSGPATIAHRLRLSPGPGEPLNVEGGTAAVSTEPAVVLGNPLAGGPWVAIYDPHLVGGHRTAFYTLDGRARIPGRFAIDFIRAPESPAGPKIGDNGFGAEVLAVRDAIVASAVDDMPDLPPGVLSPPAPIPPEAASGNYLALDLGNGRFAFYEHLQRGSIRVKPGERVRAGQAIARLGSSGSTSIGPHLHFHVADANATLAAEGQPFVFGSFDHLGAYESLDALIAGNEWIAAPGGSAGRRQKQHPAPLSVVRF